MKAARIQNRRPARELALKTLYACDIGAAAECESMLERIAESGPVADEHRRYARELVLRTSASLGRIDESIASHAANWELKRMAAIDRNILRLAAAELFFFTEVPFRVVIDEAVELAKLFGTDDSGSFVNGILDSIYKDRERETAASE